MILVSFLVLLVAIILLVVGLVRQSAAVIWAAIATSALSAILLVLGNRLASARAKAGAAPAPPEPAPPPAAAPVAAAAPPAEPPAPPPAPVPVSAESPWAAEARPAVVPAGFPIEAYDAMSVATIVPELSELGYDGLVTVRDYEVSHASRKTLLARLDVLIAGAAPAGAAAPAPAPAPVTAGGAQLAPGVGVEAEPIGTADLPVTGYAQMNAAQAQKAVAGLGADDLLTMWEYESENAGRKGVLGRIEMLYLKTGDMPIEGYDGAAVSAIKPLLAELLPPELRAVRAYEESHANRSTLAGEIDRLLAKL